MPDPDEGMLLLAPLRETQAIDPPQPWAQACNILYPRELLERLGGFDEDVLVGEDGNVAHAEVRESIPLLDAAALACIERWTFSPALRHGQPVAQLAKAPVAFRIY